MKIQVHFSYSHGSKANALGPQIDRGWKFPDNPINMNWKKWGWWKMSLIANSFEWGFKVVSTVGKIKNSNSHVA